MPGSWSIRFVSLSIAMLLSACVPAGSSRPNIVLIVLDTVRADRVRCSGTDRASTPKLDELCRRGIWFERASSTSSWTLPSHASVFTGLLPIRHGATQEHTQLDAAAPTLAELLAANGYRTFAVSANPVVSIGSGLARGFDRFEETWRPGPARSSEHPNLRAIDDVLATRDASRPFFLFVNFIEAHSPNKPSEPYLAQALGAGDAVDPKRLARAREYSTTQFYLEPDSLPPEEMALLRRLYDAEISELDALVARVLGRLEEAGVLDDTLLIVTSDHGENFGDHGHFRHIFSLYGSTVHVPLLLVPPGGSPEAVVRSEPVSLVDLFGTILAAAGVAQPERGDAPAGTSRDLLKGATDAGDQPVVAEYYYPLQALQLFAPVPAEEKAAALAPYFRRLRSIEHDGVKLIWSSTGEVEMFDLAADPHERVDVANAPRYAEQQRALMSRLAAIVADAGGPTPLPAPESQSPGEGAFEGLDEESAELLRELGYLPR